MAANLRLVFDGSGDKQVSFNFPYADVSASAAQVKSLMQAITANGDIYSDAPQSPYKAEFVVNTVTPVNIE